MESFLSGRAAVAKLKPAEVRPASGTDGFSPLFGKTAEQAIVASAAPAPSAQPPTPDFPAAPPAVAVAPTVAVAPHAHKVSVEVVRVDGAVQGIIVTCRCGERIELDCVY